MDVLTRTAGRSASLHRFGSRAHRLAFVGDDPVLGLGAGSSESALPGLVADLLTPRTRQGLDADLFTGPEWTARATAGAGDTLRLERYDAVVLAFATPSRLMPSRGRRSIRAAIDAVLANTQDDTEVIVLVADGASGDAHLARTRDFIEACRVDLARTGSGFSVVDRPADAEPSITASRVADLLATRLADRGDAWRRRDSADDEPARQRAVDASGVLDVENDELVDLLLDRARAAFATPSAELNLIDHDRMQKIAVVGSRLGAVPREQSFCDITIQHADAFVVGDAWEDARFDANPRVHGPHPIRFYAGFPVESVDGYRIGAICVYDSVPHDAGEFDLAVLRDIAITMQELIQVGALNGQAGPIPG